jgi:serine/threonine protein kinase/Tol biopolymer transport system component
MPPAIGQQLGPYEIIGLLGAGGMGDVYRARDTQLNRDVAIKILPELFALDPDRLVRFKREAQVLASLNHPNIAAIYGLTDGGGLQGLVLEFVAGPTLADRIADGPIPIDEAVVIARQIANALEAAHEQGIVHRDLKPANIKLRPDGTVKVLDFGLAKLASPSDPERSDHRFVSQSPTLTTPAMTQMGVILGTAAYMSPEQARGKALDKRTDIWAFGCVLYEMLSGQRAFAGDDVTDTLAAIVRGEPDWTRLPPETPAGVRRLLRRALEKDRARRLADMADARLELDDAASTFVADTPRLKTGGRERLAWLAATVVLLFTAIVLTVALFRNRPSASAPVRAFALPPGDWVLGNSAIATAGIVAPEGRLAMSPDGRQLAFVAADSTGRRMLWIRSMDSPEVRVLDGSEGAAFPFWSPDSRSLAFFAGGKLRRMDADGRASATICDYPGTAAGGTWNEENVILFATTVGSVSGGGSDLPIRSVPASGGTPVAVTTVDPAAGEAQHVTPFFLPGGRDFLFLVMGRADDGTMRSQGVYAASVDAGNRGLVLPAGSAAVFAAGSLLFLKGQTLFAQPFDVPSGRLTGEAVSVAEPVERGVRGGAFSTSLTGVLAYQTASGSARSQLVWFDRAGQRTGAVGEAGFYEFLDLSPDERHVSVSRLDVEEDSQDIWILDTERGTGIRLTSEPGNEAAATWSPDGSRIVFSSQRQGRHDLYLTTSDGRLEPELVVESAVNKFSYSWSSDGRFLLFNTNSNLPNTGSDVWVKPMPDGPVSQFIGTGFNEGGARFSPDNRWVTYNSDESGRSEIYVVPFPKGPGKWPVSIDGGTSARWRRDGREIFYLSADGMLMAAEVRAQGAELRVGPPQPLFQTRIGGARIPYASSADGQRFLVATIEKAGQASPITLLTNWPALVNK